MPEFSSSVIAQGTPSMPINRDAMKRILLSLALILVVVGIAYARLPYGGGGAAPTLPVITCNGTGGTTQGSCIQAPGSGGAPTITDAAGTCYQFDGLSPDIFGNYEFKSGAGCGSLNPNSHAFELYLSNQAIDGSGAALRTFRQNAVGTTQAQYPWSVNSPGSGDALPEVSPLATPLSAIFINQTTTVGYPSPARMLNAASAGQTLLMPSMPSGVYWWPNPGFINVDNLTFSSAAGVGILGIAIGAGSNVTISGGEFAWQQGQTNLPGISICRSGSCGGNVFNPTLNGVRVHDNDDGVLAGGNNQTITVTNSQFYHNAIMVNGSCSNNGLNHQFYTAVQNHSTDPPEPNTGVVTISGSKFVDATCQGDPLKIRLNSGTYTNGYAAGCAGSSDCGQNWSHDIPCGGTHTITHWVYERGPNTASLGGAYSLISFGEEWPAGGVTGSWNCSPSSQTFTANTTSGSPTITVSSNTYIVPGVAISCASGLPTGNGNLLSVSTVVSTTVTLNGNATGNATGTSCKTTRNMVLSVSNAAFIDDGDSGNDAGIVHFSYAIQCNGSHTSCNGSGGTTGAETYSATISNSYVVAAAFPGCGGSYLGPGVVDGGGNVCYANRAAAQTARAGIDWNSSNPWTDPTTGTVYTCCAYPWLPPPP